MTRRERQGLLWIILAAAGFSVMPTLVKLTYLHSTFEPLDIAIWRFLLAAPIMWTLVYFARPSRSSAPADALPVTRLLIIGVFIAAAVMAAFFSLERLPGSTYVVLLYAYPAMVALLSRLLGDAIQPRTWLALGLALIGVALTVPNFTTGAEVDVIGVGLALLNAAIIAIYYILARRALDGVVAVSRASAVMMAGTFCIMIMLIPLRGLQMPQNPPTLALLLGIGVFGTVLPVFGVNIAVQRIGAAQASLVSTVEPIMSMIVSMLILGEVIFAAQWLGARADRRQCNRAAAAPAETI